MPYNVFEAKKVCEFIRRRFPNIPHNITEEYISQIVLSFPRDLARKEALTELLGENYLPGTFILSEREMQPLYLFDEEIQDFDLWLFSKFKIELFYLKNNSVLEKEILLLGEKLLIEYSIQIVYFKTNTGKRICDAITNQEYSDIFRKILIFLITGDSEKTYNVFEEFNLLGLKISFAVLNATENYTIEKRLYQSIYSGLIGLSIKDSFGHTSLLGKDVSINIDSKASCFEIEKSVIDQLEEKINMKMKLNDWKLYYEKVICSKEKLTICWFADDFIPTIFEMKFIEEQMEHNNNLSFILVPRSGYYSNDICFYDVPMILDTNHFTKLKQYLLEGRFQVSEYGMDLGAFNGKRIRKGLLNQIHNSKILVISGARSFEMAQGLNKEVFFSGVAVCRKYTEAVTGINMNSGEGIFLHASPRTPLFYDFKFRCPERPYARITTLEFCCDKRITEIS